jgi:histidyl-tRNA synthetase
VMDDEAAPDALRLAQRLRVAGLSADVYAGRGKLGKQLKYADRRGARAAVIRGANERAAGTVAVKDLASGDQTSIDEAELHRHLTTLLGR